MALTVASKDNCIQVSRSRGNLWDYLKASSARSGGKARLESDLELERALTLAVGRGNVVAAGGGRDHLTRDIFFEGCRAAYIVQPRRAEEVVSVVSTAAAAGMAIFPRGGGMSYTRGYVPDRAKSLLIDLSAMNSIIEVDAVNMFVTVEPGVTWKQLDDSLKAHGLRVPSFGTISGAAATVGGSLSQGSVFYGSSRHGPTAEQVLGLAIVLPDGTLVRTGQAASSGCKPFFRWYGPDLTGPFLGDCGALGIKVEITLRLMRRPAHIGTLSFGFAEFQPLCEVQCAIARAGLAADCFAFDSVLQHQLTERTSLIDNAVALGKVITGDEGLLSGLKSAARIVARGRHLLDEVSFSLHVVTEHDTIAEVEKTLADVRALAASRGGRSIESTVPTMMRAEPFGSMDMALGPAGERWVPVHGIVALSDGVKAMRSLNAVLGSYRDRMVRRRVLAGTLTHTISNGALLIEILFYWPDVPHALHAAVVSAGKLAAGQKFPPNPEARALVEEIRAAALEAFAGIGAASLGIGKTVPYRQHRDPVSYQLLQKIKAAIDPRSLMNPGALGLP